MRPRDLLLHCYFERDGNQWVALCLDFTLAAQASTFQEAARKLHCQIVEYIQDGTVGEDRQHAAYLFKRRAPLSYWLKFYWTLLRQYFRNSNGNGSKAEREALPLVPAAC